MNPWEVPPAGDNAAARAREAAAGAAVPAHTNYYGRVPIQRETTDPYVEFRRVEEARRDEASQRMRAHHAAIRGTTREQRRAEAKARYKAEKRAYKAATAAKGEEEG